MKQNITTPKERMLKKIRRALVDKRENPYPDIEPTPLYPELTDSLDITFAEEFTKVQGQFMYCEDEFQLVESFINLAQEKEWKHIYCWEHALQEMLKKFEFPFVANDKDFEKAEVGITLCEALIARNGSILLSSALNSGRRLSIYPHAHVVVAYTSQLVMDIKDGLNLITQKYGDRIPSYTGIVTGPSRTADIEKTLVLGAHGPRELFVFLIDDQAPGL